MSKYSQEQQKKLEERLKTLIPSTPQVRHVPLPEEEGEVRPLKPGEAKSLVKEDQKRRYSKK